MVTDTEDSGSGGGWLFLLQWRLRWSPWGRFRWRFQWRGRRRGRWVSS